MSRFGFSFGFQGKNRYGPPGNPLLFISYDTTDTITLSVDDYDLVGSILQPVLFVDSATPIIFADFDALWATLSVLPEFNLQNFIGTLEKGIAIYSYGATRYTLNRGLRWFGMSEFAYILSDLYLNTDHYTQLENYR